MRLQRLLLVPAALVCAALAPLKAQIVNLPNILVNRNYTSPPVGLGSTETASITVVNTTTVLSASAISVAPTCTGTITFSNASGTIGTATSFSLTPEQFKTVTLPFTSAMLTGGVRGEIRGQVSVGVPTPASTGCSIAFSLETYDSTSGATHFILSGTLASPLVGLIPVLPQ